MEEENVNIVEIPEDFSKLDFDVLKGKDNVAGYGGMVIPVESLSAKTSTIKALISNINLCCAGYHDYSAKTVFQNYIFGFDDVQSIVYIRADIRHDCLGKGGDVPEKREMFGKFLKNDIVQQFIPKSLGGPDYVMNAFPLSKDADIEAWEVALEKVRYHVEVSERHVAKVIYVNEYADGPEYGYRPSKIHFHFQLYVDERAFGKFIEGSFINGKKEIPKTEL